MELDPQPGHRRRRLLDVQGHRDRDAGAVLGHEAAGCGRGTRLACDPRIGRKVITAAVGDDAVYLMVQYTFAGYWEIVSVPLH